MESTTNRMGGLNDYHVTLNQIKDLISKAMRELKKESDQFKKIQEIYNGSDIPCKLSYLFAIFLVIFKPSSRTNRLDWQNY